MHASCLALILFSICCPSARLRFALPRHCWLEILFHKRHGFAGDGEMSLYGITFDSHGYQALSLAIVVAAVSLFLVSRITPEIKAAWD